jgi:hypothetical protein
MPRLPGHIGPHRESHAHSLHADLFFNLWKGHDTASAPPVKDLATGYREWDGTHGITDWGMDMNGPDSNNPPAYPNGLGDCGWAAPDHGNIAKTGDMSLLGTFGAPKYSPGINTYFAYGVSRGEQGQSPAPANEPDQGVDNLSWLQFLHANGIIDGFCEVPLDQLDIYASVGCGLLTSIQLYDQAQQDFSNQIPWGSNNEQPDPQLGHDTWLIQTQTTGGISLISWGAVQPCTLFFRQNNITDLWLITDKDDPRVDDAALQAAITALSGTGTV